MGGIGDLAVVVNYKTRIFEWNPFRDKNRIDQLVHYFLTHGVSDHALAWHKAVVAIGARVHQQAFTMAFGDTFYLLGAALVVALVSALLLKKPARLSAGGAH